jgi:spore coat protein CotF
MNYQQTQQYGHQQQGAAANYGAHEALEIHESLTTMIDGINLFQLYRPHVTDQELAQMLDRQLAFAHQEYNGLINLINHTGMQEALPYRAPKHVAPQYGLRNPMPETPNASMNEMNDRDVASGMLCHHKSSASMKMIASLECANPQLRHALVQGSVNCNEMAYETWTYMNQSGYYQVPTMKEVTTQNVLNMYQPSTQSTQANTMYQTGTTTQQAGTHYHTAPTTGTHFHQ